MTSSVEQEPSFTGHKTSSAHGTHRALARPHACQIRVYLRDRGQINDGPVTTYEAGQSFSELPGDRHAVSANASETKPAKLLAVFVVDTNETELTIQSRTGWHNDLAMVSYDQPEYEPFWAVAAVDVARQQQRDKGVLSGAVAVRSAGPASAGSPRVISVCAWGGQVIALVEAERSK
jgi:hypothetical protein